MFTVASVRRAVAHGKLPAAAFAALQRGIGDDRSSFDAAAAQVAEAFQGTGINEPPKSFGFTYRWCAGGSEGCGVCANMALKFPIFF